MQLDIRGKNVKVSEERRQLIEKKLGRLDRYLEGMSAATVEVGSEPTRRTGEGRLIVEMTVRAPGKGSLLRAEERDNDLTNALDRLYEKMQRQITRYHERLVHHKGRPRASEVVGQTEADSALDEEPVAFELVKVKHFSMQTMYPTEAVEQMELLGHSFFIFQDAETAKVSVAYRRNTGGYGLLRPELS